MTNILKFDSKRRRVAFARLAQSYAPHLVSAVTASKLDDGTLDPNALKNDRRQVRDMTGQEMRFAATYIAGQFLVSLLIARAQLEPARMRSDIGQFSAHAVDRIGAQWAGDVGPTCHVVAEPDAKEQLLEYERETARGVFRALQLEAPNPDFDEAQFWNDVFLGVSDADPSGVVGKAARVVLLTYRDEFRRAVEADAQPNMVH